MQSLAMRNRILLIIVVKTIQGDGDVCTIMNTISFTTQCQYYDVDNTKLIYYARKT